jgi:hypothetical protein
METRSYSLRCPRKQQVRLGTLGCRLTTQLPAQKPKSRMNSLRSSVRFQVQRIGKDTVQARKVGRIGRGRAQVVQHGGHKLLRKIIPVHLTGKARLRGELKACHDDAT